LTNNSVLVMRFAIQSLKPIMGTKKNQMKKFFLFSLLIGLSIQLSAQCGYTVTVSTPDTFLCNPSPVQLNATTTGAIPINAVYQWTPTTGLNNPNIPNPIATPNSTTTYTYTVATATSTNLITNGDFEAGNIGFTTGHIPGTGGTYGLLSLNSTYAITTSPSLVHNNFVSCNDHTPTGTNMLVLNCSSIPNTSAWCQTVTVLPNTNYTFSMWAMSVVGGSPAQFFVTANGTPINTPTTLSSTTCQWQQITSVWNSGSLTSVNLCIMNQNLAESGNDAAIDDISLIEMCSASDAVTITVNNIPATPLSASICKGDSLLIGGVWRKTAGYFNMILTAANGCDSVLTTHLTLTSYTTNQNKIICAGDSVFLQNTWQTQAGFYRDTFQSVVNGCDSVVITELNLVNFFGFGDITICQGDSVFLQNAWQTQAGNYLDTLTTVNGCDSIVTVQLSLIPATPPNLGANVNICQGDSIVLSSNLPNVSFQWQDGSTANNFTVKNTGNYILTTTNANGCKASDAVFVTVVDLPEITFSNDTVLCPGDLLEITASTPNAVTYQWQDGSTNSSISTQFSGMFYLTVTDAADGCQGSDSIKIVEGQLPIVNLGNDTTICISDEITINAFGGNNRSYVWGNGSSDAAITVTNAGTYAVTVTEANCSSSDEITISETTCDCIVALPNAFTPNGKNAHFFPIIEDGCVFNSFKFLVFNRWGQQVYESTSATPGDTGWDGTTNGKEQPVDTYVWILEYKSSVDDAVTVKKGDLLLVR
jgi:gliding motility-associated-like protein